MDPNQGTVFMRTSANLAAAGVFRSNVFMAGSVDLMTQFGSRAVIRGMWASDVAGILDIYQAWDLADANAITNGVPTAGAGNANLFLQTFALVSAGAAEKGQPFNVPVQAPFVVARYTNGGAPQTQFRLHLEVVT